jgi:hypothetical protein
VECEEWRDNGLACKSLEVVRARGRRNSRKIELNSREISCVNSQISVLARANLSTFKSKYVNKWGKIGRKVLRDAKCKVFRGVEIIRWARKSTTLKVSKPRNVPEDWGSGLGVMGGELGLGVAGGELVGVPRGERKKEN